MAARHNVRRLLPLASTAALFVLAGCISVSHEERHERDWEGDGCWMFCGDPDTEYHYNFFWFPFMALLVIGGVVALIVVIANQASRPPGPPAPPAQPPQVVVHNHPAEKKE